MEHLWRERLRDRLADGGSPAVHLGALDVSPDDLWLGARLWVQAFSAAGLGRGDRLLVALPSSPTSAQVVAAALWCQLTMVVTDPAADLAALAPALDARAAVAAPGGPGAGEPWAWCPGLDGLGPEVGTPARSLRSAGRPSPGTLLLVDDDDSWLALDEENLGGTLDALLAMMKADRGSWLSYLSWSTAEGVVLDLLPCLLGAVDIVRVEDGASTAELTAVVRQRHPTGTVLPVRLLADLRRTWGDLSALHSVLDGLAVGPGLDDDLATELRRTAFRGLRGGAALSYLVTVGAPGVWRTGALGRPVGCRLQEASGGGHLVFGDNVHHGVWWEGEVVALDPSRPVAVQFGA